MGGLRKNRHWSNSPRTRISSFHSMTMTCRLFFKISQLFSLSWRQDERKEKRRGGFSANEESELAVSGNLRKGINQVTIKAWMNYTYIPPKANENQA
jgi:hypothetical protein